MNDPHTTAKEIWATGSTVGATTLFEKIIEASKYRCGTNAVSENALNVDSITIKWIDGSILEINRTDSSFWICLAQSAQSEPPNLNKSLESFYQEIVEPLKDKTGGVAAGLSW